MILDPNRPGIYREKKNFGSAFMVENTQNAAISNPLPLKPGPLHLVCAPYSSYYILCLYYMSYLVPCSTTTSCVPSFIHYISCYHTTTYTISCIVLYLVYTYIFTYYILCSCAFSAPSPSQLQYLVYMCIPHHYILCTTISCTILIVYYYILFIVPACPRHAVCSYCVLPNVVCHTTLHSCRNCVS